MAQTPETPQSPPDPDVVTQLRRYIGRSALNRVRGWARSRHRSLKLFTEISDADGPDPAGSLPGPADEPPTNAAALELIPKLARGLARLTPYRLFVLVLYCFEGLSDGETADLLSGLPELREALGLRKKTPNNAAIKVARNKARKDLRAFLGGPVP